MTLVVSPAWRSRIALASAIHSSDRKGCGMASECSYTGLARDAKIGRSTRRRRRDSRTSRSSVTPKPGAGGHGDVAVDDLDRLGHDVGGPEPARRRDVAGQREPVERGEGGVGGPPDAGLEHPAAPHRDAPLAAQVVDAAGRQVAADPAGLDVDDLGRPELDGVGAHGLGRDRLVEAHRRADRPGQLGVARAGRPRAAAARSAAGRSASSRARCSASWRV